MLYELLTKWVFFTLNCEISICWYQFFMCCEELEPFHHSVNLSKCEICSSGQLYSGGLLRSESYITLKYFMCQAADLVAHTICVGSYAHSMIKYMLSIIAHWKPCTMKQARHDCAKTHHASCVVTTCFMILHKQPVLA